MTGKRLDSDYGEAGRERYLWLVNAPHPMAAGLPAGSVNVYTRRGADELGQARHGREHHRHALRAAREAAIFAYEEGATMD